MTNDKYGRTLTLFQCLIINREFSPGIRHLSFLC